MRILAEKEAEEFLEKEGFPVSNRLITRDLHACLKYAKKKGYPVALKIVSPSIIHKSDIGGVKLDLRNEHELKRAFVDIMSIREAEAVMIEPFTVGTYLLLGIKKDQTFGHAVAVGWGGIHTEILKDVSLRVCPIDEKEALNMLKELKVYSLINGYRGEKPADIKKITKIISKLSNLPEKYHKLAELDINPMIVSSRETRIVDARIVFD